MEKRVFQERTNTLSSPIYLAQDHILLHRHPRTAYDTGLSIMPSMLAEKAAIASNESLQNPSTISSEELDETQSLSQSPANTIERGLDHEAARAARYLKAEQALAQIVQYSLQNHSSARDLQIDALRNAMSALHSNIVDARERVETLRPLLVDRQADPVVYRAMQRQRWMDERRQYAAEQLSKALEKNLATLTSLPAPVASTSNAKPKVTVNLERFFDSSWHRVQARNRTRRRINSSSRPRQEKKLDFPHVHHHRHLLSLKLTPPDPRLAFFKSTPNKPEETPTVSAVVPTEPSTAPYPDTSSSASLAPISEVSEVILAPPAQPSGSGTATIWYSSPRTTAEILSESELVISMPDYVSDLLEGFNTLQSPVSFAPRPPPSSAPAKPHLPVSGPSQPVTPIKSATQSKSTSKPTSPVHPAAAHTPPPPALHASPSRRRLSAILALPDALTSRIGSDIGRASKRFSTPPPSSFVPRSVGAPIEEEDARHSTPSVLAPPVMLAARRFSGRVSFSASHLPDTVRLGGEGDADAVASATPSVSASHGELGGGRVKIVARLRRRISVLRKKA